MNDDETTYEASGSLDFINTVRWKFCLHIYIS